MDKTYFDDRVTTTKKFPHNIFVNQAGYKPSGIKRAVIRGNNGDTAEFFVEDANGAKVYEGKARHFGLDRYSGDEVCIADFTDFKECGRYRICAENDVSLEFSIDENVLDDTFCDVMKAFYFLRCGTELEEKHAGEFVHKPCHTKKAYLFENKEVTLDVSGGWHDAGDYGRYVTPGCCALAHILLAYKMFPDSMNVRLNIPESESGIPDILEECKCELLWMMKMQRDDGGVYHKATTMHHVPFVMPEDDIWDMYVFPVSSIATADFAAIAAMASVIYKELDLELSQRLLSASEKSLEWLENNPGFIGFSNPEGCNTGTYGEYDDKDNRFWAYAELYSATGDEIYHEKLKVMLKMKFPLTALGYASVGGFGALSYLLCDNEYCDSSLKSLFRECFIERAEYLKKLSDECGYGAAMAEEDYAWGSNMNLMTHGMIFAIADYLEKGDRFKPYAVLQVDYLLGVNATGYSYVTGTGEFCCNYPHLRPAHADGIERCMPGMVSGGANRRPADADARILIPEGTPPMKCYADDVGCYSLNEITIYWNAPTVFVLAYIC